MPEMSDSTATPSSSAPPPPAPSRPVPTRLDLLLTFARIAAFGFGGVMAWSRRVIVQDRRWLSAEEFNEQLALCQVLPGGNIVNFSVMFGYRCGGGLGSVAALVGLVGPPTILMIVAGTLYRYYGSLPALRGVFAGLAAAAGGLLIANAVQMFGSTVKDRLKPAHLVAAVTFIAAGVMRWPLLWVMAVIIPISVAFAWWEKR
jgi:chromate transporter